MFLYCLCCIIQTCLLERETVFVRDNIFSLSAQTLGTNVINEQKSVSNGVSLRQCDTVFFINEPILKSQSANTHQNSLRIMQTINLWSKLHTNLTSLQLKINRLRFSRHIYSLILASDGIHILFKFHCSKLLLMAL